MLFDKLRKMSGVQEENSNSDGQNKETFDEFYKRIYGNLE